ALTEITAQVSRVRARFARAIISAVFNWAEDNDLIQASPAHGLKLPGDEPPRTRVYSEDEIRRFWLALSSVPRADDTARALKIILLTGKRLSEVVTARKVDLHLTGGDPRWVLPPPLTKNARGDDVPLTATTVALFAEQMLAAGKSEYVFPART